MLGWPDQAPATHEPLKDNYSAILMHKLPRGVGGEPCVTTLTGGQIGQTQPPVNAATSNSYCLIPLKKESLIKICYLL